MRSEFDAYFARAERSRRHARAWISYEGVFRLIPKDWRSDARYFLKSNIIEMVIAPYETIDGPRLPLEAPFWGMLQDDIRAIVDRSEAIARDRNRGYVSATSVAIALGQLADNLRTTSLQIWGPD